MKRKCLTASCDPDVRRIRLRTIYGVCVRWYCARHRALFAPWEVA